MRFVYGLLGSFLGLAVTSVALGFATGSMAALANPQAFAISTIISALIYSGITVGFEKSNWNFVKYAATQGAISAIGLLVMIIVMAALAGGAAINPIGLGIGLVITFISGSFGGVGYRLLAGPKAEKK